MKWKCKQECTYGQFAGKVVLWFALFASLTVAALGFNQWRVNTGYDRALEKWEKGTVVAGEHNTFWKMVAGEKPPVNSNADTIVLTEDIRVLFIDESVSAQQRSAAASRLIKDPRRSYSRLPEPVWREHLAGGELSKSTLESLDKLRTEGTVPIVNEAPTPQRKDFKVYNGWSKFLGTCQYWLSTWFCLSAVTYWLARIHRIPNTYRRELCRCADGLPEDVDWGWYIPTFILLLPFLLPCLVVGRMVAICKAIGKRGRETYVYLKERVEERNHPARDQIRQARASLRNLQKLLARKALSSETIKAIKAETERAKELFQSAKGYSLAGAMSSSSPDGKITKPDRHAQHRLSRVRGELDGVQNMLEAMEEVDKQSSQAVIESLTEMTGNS